jgi:hypothetical protein
VFPRGSLGEVEALTTDVAAIRLILGIGIEGSGKPLVPSWDRDLEWDVDPHARIPEIDEFWSVEEDPLDQENTVARQDPRLRLNRPIRIDVPHGWNDRAASSKGFDDGIDE